MGSSVYLSCLLPESLKCKKWLISCIFCIFNRTEYLIGSEGSNLALLENAINYWVLSYD